MAAKAESMLARVPLFEGLSKKEIKRVASECNEETFNEGQNIVDEGKSGGRFYLIIDGQAKVISRNRTRTTLGPGDFFGEISIIDGGPRSATVRADGYVRALSIASWNFLSVMEENFPIARKVMEQLCDRIREHDKSLTH
jgi:CRP/FNR family cyclic AMP-dependent transcriptional regulator